MPQSWCVREDNHRRSCLLSGGQKIAARSGITETSATSASNRVIGRVLSRESPSAHRSAITRNGSQNWLTRATIPKGPPMAKATHLNNLRLVGGTSRPVSSSTTYKIRIEGKAHHRQGHFYVRQKKYKPICQMRTGGIEASRARLLLSQVSDRKPCYSRCSREISHSFQ